LKPISLIHAVCWNDGVQVHRVNSIFGFRFDHRHKQRSVVSGDTPDSRPGYPDSNLKNPELELFVANGGHKEANAGKIAYYNKVPFLMSG